MAVGAVASEAATNSVKVDVKTTTVTVSGVEQKTDIQVCSIQRQKGLRQITIPEGMSLKEARSCLERQEAEEEQAVAFSERFDVDPWDGAALCFQALKSIFGFIEQTTIPAQGFFNPAQPPAMLTVQTGIGSEIKVPWGRFVLPGVEGYVQTGAHQEDPDDPKSPVWFVFHGLVKKKHLPVVQSVTDLIHAKIRAGESIYRGKAVDAKKKFIDVKDISPADVILPVAISRLLQASLYTMIEHTAAVRRAGVPLKRGVLLEGEYGTGKSLTAQATARLCQKHGWTFVLVKDHEDFLSALVFAKRYQPAVVFSEDVDKMLEGDRTKALNTVLEDMDGVLAKGSEVMVVLTTNHVENINEAALRPGRIDAIVKFTKPDADSARRLLLKYAGKQMASDVDLDVVGKACAGLLPASIAEVGSRAKLSAIARMGADGTLLENDVVTLSTEDLVDAAEQLQLHQKLMESPRSDPKATVKTLRKNIREVFAADAVTESEILG